MAYPTLVSLENIIDQILHDDRSSISPNGKQHIISLDKYVICVRAFLEDCPEKASKNLEARIRDVAMRAEDMIEWFMNEQIRHYVFRYIHWVAELRRIKFESQLRKVTDEMESIAGDVVEIKKSSIIVKDMQFNDSVGASSSSSSEVADAAAGKSKDLIDIIDWLCGDSPELQFLPITGMGGIGKTTLARNAYNDPLIVDRFLIRVWITVSQDYSEERILADLINSMKEFIPVRRNNAEIPQESNSDKADKVYQALYGRRFLIVIDDIWSTKVLDYVKNIFPKNNNRSRILLTTRLGNVAVASTSMPSHVMHPMDAKFLLHFKGWGAQKLLKSMQNERRISIFPSDIDSFANISSSTIRTIMFFQSYNLKSFGSFRLLRVLDVLGLHFWSSLIPDQFFELFHLRYLAFRYDGRLPRAITNLQNLQTLILRECRFALDNLCPIWNMPQLRHLILLDHVYEDSDPISSTLHPFLRRLLFIDRVRELAKSGPFPTPPLINLQTLVGVHNLGCFKRTYHLIPNIKKLSIMYTHRMTCFFFHNLVHLRRLEKLKLEIESELGEPFRVEVPELVLPTSLKKLALIGWGRKLPHLTIDCIGPLPNLEVLKLRKFDFLEQTWITSEESFPKLRFLLIEDSDLKQWESEGRSHFPVLEQLILRSCRSLRRLPGDMGEIPTLKLIEVKDYMESLAYTIKQIQGEQLECGGDVFQLRRIKLDPVAVAVTPSKVEKKTKVVRKRSAVPRGLHPVRDMLRRGY